MSEKICKGCKRSFPKEDFKKKGCTTYTTRCSRCRLIQARAALKAKGLPLPELPPRHLDNPKPQPYPQIMADYSGGCQLCERQVDLIVVDHDHKTNLVRGLLCSACNSGLGQFRDDVELLQKAIAYLKEPPLRGHNMTYKINLRYQLGALRP